MNKKNTVLIKVSYLIDLSETAINTNEGLLDKIINEISDDKKLKIDNIYLLLNWNGTSSLILDPKNFNCGKCSNCGQWTTDREKPEALEGICNGATVDDKLLCDECLPSDHRWSF